MAWDEDDAAPPKREIIPLQDRVLIEPIITDTLSAGGIVLTGEEFKYQHAKVLAVGQGRLMASGRMAMDMKVGDIVIYGDLNNTVEDKLNGKRVLLVVEQAIVAIVKG
jgi:co-chaperonin GroES (HSP10)